MDSVSVWFSELVKKWSDFGLDATACWSTDPTKKVGYGNHKIMCVRGFPGLSEAYDYALDQLEDLQRTSDGKLPWHVKINYIGAVSHYSWRSLPDREIKREICKETGAKEDQIEIKNRH